ncbi:MAG: ABC transporter substrate-binding protein, partial [Deltaproteobacteria bacterium]|nr:ABC transporter substrate-binding protein [Deltaproteobacteria bacterium]
MNKDQNFVNRRQFIKGASTALVGAAVLPLFDPNVVLAADGSLTVAITASVSSFSPANTKSHDAMAFTQAMFENLMEVDEDGQVKPCLATDYQVSNDGLTYTFNLRDDVYFHNGEKFTAADVKYSYDHVRDPKTKFMGRRFIWAPIKEVVVESPTRVKFLLKRPYWGMLLNMSKYMGVFQNQCVEKYGDKVWMNPVGIGTGPASFVKWRQNDFAEYKAHKKYWRKGVPAWKKLVIKTIPEDTTRVAFLMTNSVQIIAAPPAREFIALQKMPGITGGSRPTLGGQLTIEPNVNKKPWDDANFRIAVSKAIDREAIKKLYAGEFDPFAVVNGFTGWPRDEKANAHLEYDLASAKEYMAKSKYADGVETDIVIPATPYLVSIADAALLIQSQLKKIGVKINLRTLDTGSFWGKYKNNKTFDTTMVVMMTPPNPHYLFTQSYYTGAFIARGKGISIPEFDKMVDKTYTANSQAEFDRYIEQMQAFLAREAYGIVIGGAFAQNLWRS